MGFLLSFSDKFQMALALWPLVSFALTVPILALLYRRDGRLRLWSAVSAYLIVLYALGLACFTLYPLPSGSEGPGITYGIPPQLDPFGFIGDIAKDGMRAVLQDVFNVVFFVPLGFFCSRAFRRGLLATLAIGFLISLLIETAQLTGCFWMYPHAYRTFDVNDLMWNTAGAGIGWACALLAAKVVPPGVDEVPETTSSPGFLRRCVALALDVVLMQTVVFVVGAIALLVYLQVDPDVGANVEALALVAGALAFMVLVFLVVEWAVPWARGGRTPGGGFVRMTVETRKRQGARRFLFYLLRTVCLMCAWVFFPLVPLVLLVFFAVKRCMPYDLL